MKPSVLRLTLVLLVILLTGCNVQEAPPSDTMPTPDTTAAVTTAPETTAPETTISANRIPTAKKNLKHTDAGLRPFTITSSNRIVAEGEPGERVTYIYGYADGTATLSFTDCFGHTASCDVTVSGEEITLTPHPPAEDFIEAALDCGANGYDTGDDTAAIQRAIDSAKPGETVYLYPGIYVVDTLVMRDGVTLEMYTTMTDATEGFTDKLARQTQKGEITVLSGVRIMNNGKNQPGAEGSSNFTIRGGVLDQKETSKGAIIFGRADGVLMENVILKDIKNNHAVQLTGCTNTSLRNCMFAGYTWGGTFTREVIQVEASHPGATGSAATAPLTFHAGEYYYCENIEITHCYFGKSDECGAPLMAIGHHGHQGPATVTGFRITDNVFDEMLYAGIRYANIVDTEISGNTFISTAAYLNIKDNQAKTPACIIIYSPGSATTYTSEVNGKSINHSAVAEQSGTHNLRITGNTFRIGADADKRIIHVTGTGYIPGLIFQTGLQRQAFYNTEAYPLNGYVSSVNFVEDVVFAENTITFEGKPAYEGYFLFFQQVRGLTVERNTVNLPEGVSFSNASRDIPGLKTAACTTGRFTEDYAIFTGPKGMVMLGDVKLTSLGTKTVKIKIDGDGHLDIADDNRGNGSMTPVAAEGSVFSGWFDASGKQITGELRVKENVTITAKFTAK